MSVIMEDFEDLPLLSEEEENELENSKLPFGGLLGNSVQLRVIREIVADPWRDFRPKNLKVLTSASAPRIKNTLDNLVSLGFLKNVSSDSQRPVYRANLKSKSLTALTFLAYAITDDRDRTNYMDEAISDYCGENTSTNNLNFTVNHVTNVSYQVNISQDVAAKMPESAIFAKESWMSIAQGA